MTECLKCGQPILFVKRWWSSDPDRPQWVVCDEFPDELANESYVEVEKEFFVTVCRHKCRAEDVENYRE